MKSFCRPLSLLSPFRWRIVLAVLLGCIVVASNMLLLGMATYLIAEAALIPLMAMLTLPSLIVRLLSLSRAATRYAERLVSHDVTLRLLARLRAMVYSRLEPLAPASLLTYRSGDMLSRLLADIEELNTIYLKAISPALVALSISLLTFALFTIFSPLLAWTALAFLVATGLGIPFLSGMLSRTVGKRQVLLRAELKAQLVDGLQGVQDLLAYGQADAHQRTIADLDSQLARLQHRMAIITGLQQALNDLLANLALWTILVLAIPLVVSKAISGVYLGFLAVLLLASFEIMQPLGQATQFLGNARAAGARLFEMTDAPPAITEPAHPLPAPVGHTLAFEHVSFAYAPCEYEVLHDITLRISPGQRVALVGKSGSGKTTIGRLVLRLWDPTQGVVRLDGHDLRHYASGEVRASISIVDQETYLFNDTLRGNLALGKPSATPEEIGQALELAQLSEFASQLPHGLDTWIGEQGLRLSGGERQRVAIARALLKNAPLLILDEATANLDSLTERALLKALDRLMQGRTALIITHRLLEMERMDEIVVLDQGQIRERGTHAQLLAHGDLYCQLLDAQNSVLSLA